jgi:hypothetical protein
MQIILIEQDPNEDEQNVELRNADGSCKWLNSWHRTSYDSLIIMLAQGLSVAVTDDCEPMPLLED